MTQPEIPVSSDDNDGSLKGSLARETALREILEVISASRGNELPVLDAIVRNAGRLCEAALAGIWLVNESRSHAQYASIWGEDQNIFYIGHEVDLSGPLQVAVTMREARIIHTHDLADDPLYFARNPTRVKIVEEAGVRTFLTVPLVSDGVVLGCFNLNRFDVRPFEGADIALVETFAQQAVIAIENVRQFRELQERLKRETATKNILSVISQSRDDEDPVFDAILQSAVKLCDAEHAGLVLVNEARTHTTFRRMFGLQFTSKVKSWPLDAGQVQTEAARTGTVVHETDLKDSALYQNGDPTRIALVDELGARTALAVPMLQADQAIGVIVLHRIHDVRPFSDNDIQLVESFAQQAVIAIENVRQFREVQTRLERERASTEVLEIISQSRDNEAPVFRAIMARAERLCHAEGSGLQLLNQAGTHLVQSESRGEDHGAFPLGIGFELSSPAGQCVAVREKRIVHIEDLKDTDLYREGHEGRRNLVDIEGIRTHLHVPLMRNDLVFGNISLSRKEPKPFTPDQISLVETFAQQTVIAIENVRQFREVHVRLEREEASREILQVISASRSDTMPVFEVILQNAARLCGAQMVSLNLIDTQQVNVSVVAHWGERLRHLAVGEASYPLNSPYGPAVSARKQKVVYVEDLAETEFYKQGDPVLVETVDREGVRTFLAVPLVAGRQSLGCLTLFRREVRPFDDSQIELIKSFAEQAVIAIENVQQFKALETLNAELGDRVAEQVGEIERMGRLKRFLSPQVADAVVSSGDVDLLSSHRAMIAILFCDIRGFTAFCESAEPEETIEVLQTFHETLGKLINQAGAGFDHRAGDGIMVVFNDPVPCDDPAGAALHVAIQMRAQMAELCGKWRKLGHRMGFGVGISLGYATVGMVGFEGRYDYTANGSAVNLASRLCDQAEDQEILLSQRAATALEDIACVESAGELTLKGFHAPVDVFRVTGLKEMP